MNDAPTFESPPTTIRVSESAVGGDIVGAVTATDVDGRRRSPTASPATGASFVRRSTATARSRWPRGSTYRHRKAGHVPSSRLKPTTESATPSLTATVEVTITVVSGPVSPPPRSGGGFFGGGFAGGGGGGGGGPSPSVDRLRVERDARHRRTSTALTTSPRATGPTARRSVAARERLRLRTTPSTPTTWQDRRARRGPRVRARQHEPRAARHLVRWLNRLGLRQRPQQSFSPTTSKAANASPSATSHSPPATAPRAASGPPTGRCGCSTAARTALFAYDLESGELLAEYELVSANGDPHGHLVRRDHRLGLRPRGEAALRLPPAHRARRAGGRGGRWRWTSSLNASVARSSPTPY